MTEGKKKIYAVPLYIVLLVPFVVYGHLGDTGLSDFPWFSAHGQAFDLFLYHKRNVILLAACLILVFGAVMLIRKDFWEAPRKLFFVFLPFVIYVGLMLVSSVASPYRAYAWSGMMEQYESVFVVAGYFLICVYAYMACCREVFTAFGIFCAIIGGIGTLQFLGMDIYRTKLWQRMIMPENLKDVVFDITVEAGRSYCSLSNPNYVGMLCCLTIPVIVMLVVCAKTWRGKILYGTAFVLMFFSLLGSRSKSGIVTLSICMVWMLFLFRKPIAQKVRLRKKCMNGIIISTAVVLCAVSCVLVYRWGELWGYDDHPDTRISRIVTADDGVEIVYRGKELFFHINYDGDSLSEVLRVTDENGHTYSVSEEEGALHFQEKTLSRLTAALAQYGNYVALEIWDGNFYWYFTNQTDEGAWRYLTRYGKPDKLDSSAIPVCKWLEGKERIASCRGYIWSRTLPIIKETVFLGSGQDSFAAVFPNNDYLGKARWGYKDMLITKPHCMYMQIAVQSGLVSLIALFLFWGRLLRGAFTRKTKDVHIALLKAVAVGITGYLLMGVTNDANIGVAPVFWLLFGVGLRLERECSFQNFQNCVVTLDVFDKII